MGSFTIFVCLALSSAIQGHADTTTEGREGSIHCCECCATNSTDFLGKDIHCAVNGTWGLCITRYGLEVNCTDDLKSNQTRAEKAFPQCYGKTSPPPPTVTTTMTAMDSSASSGSGDSSASLASLGSGLGDSSSGYSSGSFNQGSWASDSFGSAASSGSGASGSWGSLLPIWLWIALLCLCCCCCGIIGGIGAMMSKGKKQEEDSLSDSDLE